MRDYTDEQFKRAIFEAVKNNRLILFVGAGVSKLCGLPLWDELANRMLSKCISTPEVPFDYSGLEMLKRRFSDPREKITIAYRLLKDAGIEDEFYCEMRRSLTQNASTPKETIEKTKLIRSCLWRLSSTIFTTNADEILDVDRGDDFVLFKRESIGSFVPSAQPTIVHLHGSLRSSDSLVFTTVGYLKTYSKEGPIRGKLEEIFSKGEYTILFLGYGFRDMQLLDFLVNEGNKGQRPLNAFYLDGYFSNEEIVFDSEQKYYEEYGVSLMSYPKDKENYDGLVTALRYLAEEADKISPLKQNIVRNIKGVIDEGPSGKGVCSLTNFVSGLNQETISFIANEIGRSSHAKEWVKAISLDPTLKKVFFESDSDKTLGLRLIENIAPVVNGTLLDFIREHLKGLANDFDSNATLFNDWQLTRHMLSIGFSNYALFSDESFISFIKEYSSKSIEPNLWISFMARRKDVLKWCPKDVAVGYLKIAIETSNKRNDLYTIEVFVDSCKDMYTKAYADETFAMILKSRNEEPYEELSREVFETILLKDSDKNDINDWKDYVLALCIPHLSPSLANKFFNDLIASDSSFEKCLAIFLANERFNELGASFFERLPNLGDILYFAEIYSLVRNNVEAIKELFMNPFLAFIDSIDYSSRRSLIWTMRCKLDLMKLFETFGEKEIQARLQSLEAQYSEKLGDGIMDDFFLDPLQRSKSFWSSSRVYLGNKDFNKTLASASSPEELSRCLSDESIRLDDRRHAFEKETKRIVEDLKILEYIESTSPNWVASIPIDMAESLLDYAVNQSGWDCNRSCRLVLNSLRFLSSFDQRRILQSLYYSSFVEPRKWDPDIARNAFDFAESCVFDNEQLSEYEDYHIIGHPHFLKMSIMLHACQTDVSLYSRVKEHLNLNDSFAKAAMASSIHFLWHFDKEWCATNIKSIFNNIGCKGKNLSYIGFQYSQFYGADFIELLNSTGILSDLMESEDFGRYESNYGQIALQLFIYNKVTENVMKTICDSSQGIDCLYMMFMVLSKNSEAHFDHDRLRDTILYLLGKADFWNDKVYLGIKLIPFYGKFGTDEELIRLIIALFSKKNQTYLCDSLKKAILSVDSMGIEDKKNIVKAFVSSLSSYYEGVGEICNLIDAIPWNENEKKELINAVGARNPEFFLRLNADN